MVDTTDRQTTDYRQTTESCHHIVPGGESARDKKRRTHTHTHSIEKVMNKCNEFMTVKSDPLFS